MLRVVFSLFILACLSACTSSQQPDSLQERQVGQGDMSHHGGTATIRKSYIPESDDPATTNDESNDQQQGHFGTVTIIAHNLSSGNSYALDADVEGTEVQRLYFQKGGWVDFDSSEIDSEGIGSGIDERGREWEFEGFEGSQTVASAPEEDADEADTE